MFSKIGNTNTKQKSLDIKERRESLKEKTFITVEEVAQELGVSKSYAYKVVRELNAELRKMGYLTVVGRVNTNFFRKKVCYSEQNA